MIPPEADLHIPKEMPVFTMSDNDIGEGWQRVGINELVRSSCQVYTVYPFSGWHISSYRTSEGYLNRGVSNYRKPASARAWFTVLFPLIRKQVNHLIGRD